MNKMITNDRSLVPFPVIAAASSGDVTAMDIVLKHYSGYISALATRTAGIRICALMRICAADWKQSS